MNDLRWGATSLLLFLGAASLFTASGVCAATAPFIMRAIVILDFRRLLDQVLTSALLLSLASTLLILALLCGLGFRTWRGSNVTRAPRASDPFWQIRWIPLSSRKIDLSALAPEVEAPADEPVAVSIGAYTVTQPLRRR